MSLPRSWSEIYDRLAAAVGGRADANEWVMQALEQTWGVQDPQQLERGRRSLAMQKMSGVVLALEEAPGDLAFYRDARPYIAEVFSRYFKGVELEGPPWRLTAYEDLPTQSEWEHLADFGEGSEE